MRHVLALSVLFLSLFAAPAAAQSTVLLPSTATAGPGNTYDNASWGNYSQAGWTGYRMQFSYAGSNFFDRGVGSRVVISAIRFRSGLLGPGSPGAVNLTAGLACSTGRFAATALDLDYALNAGPDETTVYYGPVLVQSTSVQGVDYVQIPFQTPFSFDPTQGDLLFDISYNFNTLAHVPAGSFARFGDAMTSGGSLVYGATNSQFAVSHYAGVPIVTLVYSVPTGAARVESRGSGCGELAATVYEQFGSNPFDLAGASTAASQRLAVVPVAGGYQMTHTTGSFATPTTATALTLGDEQCSAPITLPFPFPYLDKNGVQQSTSQIVVSSNGFVWLDPTQTVSDYSPTIGELCSGAPRIAMHWRDLDPGVGGTITHGPSAGGTAYHVTFQDVRIYQSSLTTTVQLTLLPNGRFRIDHGPTLTTTSYGICGWSPGRGARVPAAVDLSAANGLQFGLDLAPLAAVATARPAFGQNLSIRVDNIAPGTVLGVMCVGLLPAQVDLSFLGMTGCTRWSTWDVTHLLLPNGAGSTSWQMGIPNDLGFLGLQLYEQAAMFSPAVNPLGISVSNAIVATIGAW